VKALVVTSLGIGLQRMTSLPTTCSREIIDCRLLSYELL
jgi:hypothetical protein